MVMQYFKNIFNRLLKNEKKILGRWNIEQCDKKINNKIDLSNEDHCGPCGQYLLEKTSLKNTNNAIIIKKTNTIEKKDITSIK
jgi:hypothetical protein